MIKVKKSFIEKVICYGYVRTRDYFYFCNGAVDFDTLEHFRFPLVYVVFRKCILKPGDPQADFPTVDIVETVEIVGLFDEHGRRY